MSDKEIFHEPQALYDPEPLTIAISLIAAITPIGVLFAERSFKKQDTKKAKRINIRNKLYDATRALNRAKLVLQEFTDLLAENGYLEDVEKYLVATNFELGRAPLVGSRNLVGLFKKLYRDSYDVGKDLNNAVISLAKLLDENDFETCIAFSQELNGILNDVIRPITYRGYVTKMGYWIGRAKTLVGVLGKRYGFMDFQDFQDQDVDFGDAEE